MIEHVDVAIVGAGIVGLAHAWMAARAGRRVVVFERSPRACGASIRNFGMIWPIGQPPGELHQLAMCSRALWLEAAEAAGLWVQRCGSLHLAFRGDEMAVLEEFAAQSTDSGYDCQLLSSAEVVERAPAARREGLLGALWSPTELGVDPREALRTLPRWLAERHGVELQFNTTIVRVDGRRIESADGRRWQAERTFVCGGADFETLFPELFATAPLVRCKLQMLRTVAQPGGWRIGPHLAGGLTLRHYANFEGCPSLVALKQRIAAKSPALDRYGVHVMAAQNRAGEVILGDSHEYGDAIEPFDKAEIDTLMLEQLRQMIELRDWTIAERWHGIYAKHPGQPLFTANPQPEVTICTGTGGAGMTMSFGLAEQTWQEG